jgi:glycosyltransferase involved in cell wall biosynthesis
VRVTYWTTAPLEPLIEAVSQEVEDLARHFDGRVFAVNPHLSLKIRNRGRILGFNPSFDPLLRLLVPALEWRADLNHVYTESAPWLFHKTLRRKPIVFTIASEKGAPLPQFLERCAAIVAQTPGMVRKLLDLGVKQQQLRLIYPGVDLQALRPRSETAPRGAPRILLATFPRSSPELEERGVLFLLEIARRYPEFHFSLLSRPWRTGGTALDEVKNLVATRALNNVAILEGVQSDMRKVYLEHDFTVIPYTVADGGKECPRSLVETLACGVPVLISDVAPFSEFVREQQCGETFGLDAAGFAAAVERASSRYSLLSTNAATCARMHFDIRNTTRAYSGIYDGLQ